MFYSSALCMQLRVGSSPESPATGLLGLKLPRHLGVSSAQAAWRRDLACRCRVGMR